MKKSQLKSIIRECVREVLFDEGVLSSIIVEVTAGLAKSQALLSESSSFQQPNQTIEDRSDAEEESRKKLEETKRKMLDAIGNDSMRNIFEGVEPMKGPSHPAAPSPLSGRDPQDSGVDITGLMNIAGKKWKQLK